MRCQPEPVEGHKKTLIKHFDKLNVTKIIQLLTKLSLL